MYHLIAEGLRSKVFRNAGQNEGELSICKIPGISNNSKGELLNEYEIVSQLDIEVSDIQLKLVFMRTKQLVFTSILRGFHSGNSLQINLFPRQIFLPLD